MMFSDPGFGPVSNLTEEEKDAENCSNQNNQNGNTDPDSLINEISKQQIVIQYLKVSLHEAICSLKICSKSVQFGQPTLEKR